jgi:ubiquinol-cytochrome c reductase cytochrome b subunit
VLIDGAYRAPREVNFWLGLSMLFLVLALSLSGYLLPWDQKGYWATKVTTSIASMTPVVGPALQHLLVGGSEYGHHTLTRFLALHAGVLPGGLLLLLVGHIYLFRRWGVTVREGHRDPPDGRFWPDQVLRDAVASLVVMAAVLGLVLWTGGAHLGSPADPTEPYAAARPEWYFMFLFQWLKYFPAGWEVVGAQVIPGGIVALVAAMPFIGKWRLGHRFNLGFAAALLLGIGTLTRQAYVQDRSDPAFVAALEEAEEVARRVHVLADSPDGIPPDGGLALLRNDPLTRGPRLFAQNCATCHRFDGHDGLGVVPPDPPEASDLAGFGSREWLSGLLDPEQLVSDRYFGATEHSDGRMARFVSRGLASLTEEERNELDKIVVALSAEAELPAQAEADVVARQEIEEGRSLMSSEAINCTRCHAFREATEGDVGPLLTGWGSREWMLGLLDDPGDEAYYGELNDGMPAFGADQLLSPQEMGLIVDWLRGDWYEPGRPNS